MQKVENWEFEIILKWIKYGYRKEATLMHDMKSLIWLTYS